MDRFRKTCGYSFKQELKKKTETGNETKEEARMTERKKLFEEGRTPAK